MRHRILSVLLIPTALVVLTACDSSTDVDDLSSQGRWDAVGAFQAAFPDVRLDLSEASDGTITGTWRRGSNTGSVSGVNASGQVTFQLVSFETAGTITFQGQFTNRYRLEGDIVGYSLGDAAVFRRMRF